MRAFRLDSLLNKVLALGAAGWVSLASGFGADAPMRTSPSENQLSALRTLPMADGRITAVSRLETARFTGTDGRIHDHLPPRTVVQAELHPAPGSHIRVEIWLPDPADWNARMVGIGNGGAAGSIPQGELAAACARGYAVAATDLGTAPDPDSGVGNREVWKDFGFRATHLQTLLTKQVITAFYGRGPDFAYFKGSSTGGQQGLQEAQRYPEDYDGIVAGVPAHCRTPLHAYFLWNDQILTKCPFTPEQEASVVAAGNEYAAQREIPAIAGKFISDPRRTAADIEAVIALAMTKDATLTAAHAAALRKLFGGPRQETTGEIIFSGVPFGCAFAAARGNLYLFKWVFGATKPTEAINFGADLDRYTAALGPYLNAENPDLSRFAQRGGKLLVTTGAADAVVPCFATIDYYERVLAECGGLEQTQSFFRLFLVPGLGHGTSPGINKLPDLLEVVRAWRETGEAPATLEGRRVVGDKTELVMPVYPYPQKTAWDAAASAFKAAAGPRGGVERISPRFRPRAED